MAPSVVTFNYNGSSPEKRLHGTSTPCWRANDAVAQEKQRATVLSFQGSTELFALQQGVFVLNVTASLQRGHSFSFHYRDKETSNIATTKYKDDKTRCTGLSFHPNHF